MNVFPDGETAPADQEMADLPEGITSQNNGETEAPSEAPTNENGETYPVYDEEFIEEGVQYPELMPGGSVCRVCSPRRADSSAVPGKHRGAVPGSCGRKLCQREWRRSRKAFRGESGYEYIKCVFGNILYQSGQRSTQERHSMEQRRTRHRERIALLCGLLCLGMAGPDNGKGYFFPL